MTYPAITIAAFAILGTHIESPYVVANILNQNLPLVGGGTTREFTPQNVQRIMAFFQQNQPDFYQYALGFDEDANIGQTREFLLHGGLGRIAELPGINPNQALSYDSLMVATNAIIRAAGGESRPLPSRGSFVRTRETVGLGDMDAGYGQGGYGQGGYGQGEYGQGEYGQGGYPGRQGGRRPPRYPRNPYGGAGLGQWPQW